MMENNRFIANGKVSWPRFQIEKSSLTFKKVQHMLYINIKFIQLIVQDFF